MSQDSGGVDQAVSRALRDNLAPLQRTAEELYQAINDVVASCSSSRPTNALPSMLRAEAAAASLAAALDVLARFVTNAMKPAQVLGAGEVVSRAVTLPPPEPPAMPAAPPHSIPAPMGAAPTTLPPPPVVQPPPETEIPAAAPRKKLADTVLEEPAPAAVAPPPPPAAPAVRMTKETFDVKGLPQEEQEMHRRASRVAKVSMQDIKMLKAEAVRLGRENKDLCKRLRDEFDKAKKEYDRRFKAIQSHPVDYFYDWAVEILADGDPSALGDYPYASPNLPR